MIPDSCFNSRKWLNGIETVLTNEVIKTKKVTETKIAEPGEDLEGLNRGPDRRC